ncbi:MAG: hypothetical protein IKQ40_07790 [Lachnospiraceae bacterium]|nr:hypothetical protein [Lachnospiraceae bacterium]
MKEPQTIDELLKVINDLSSKFEKMIKETNGERKLADILMTANDPDSRFKAKTLMMIITEMERVKMLQDYITKPVKIEGIMQQKPDGMLYIDDDPVLDGMIIEYMTDSEWEAGRMVYDNNTRRAKIVDVINVDKIKVDKIHQIKARIRMNG